MKDAATREFELRGLGIHTGTASTVHILRRSGTGGGIRFFWAGNPSPFIPEDLGRMRKRSKRSTQLDYGNGLIRTPEHLLAAALFFTDFPLDIHCDSEEPPAMDGSALPFFEMMAKVAPEAAKNPAWHTYDSNLKWGYEGTEGTIRVEPAESFSVKWELDRSPLRQHFSLSDPTKAIRKILPARTFIFLREWKTASLNSEFFRGARYKSGMLYAETTQEFAAACATRPDWGQGGFPLLHPETERLKYEPVKHKILDLLGDLALLDLSLPRLRIQIRNGGHALNHLLLEQLQHERK